MNSEFTSILNSHGNDQVWEPWKKIHYRKSGVHAQERTRWMRNQAIKTHKQRVECVPKPRSTNASPKNIHLPQLEKPKFHRYFYRQFKTPQKQPCNKTYHHFDLETLRNPLEDSESDNREAFLKRKTAQFKSYTPALRRKTPKKDAPVARLQEESRRFSFEEQVQVYPIMQVHIGINTL